MYPQAYWPTAYYPGRYWPKPASALVDGVFVAQAGEAPGEPAGSDVLGKFEEEGEKRPNDER